MTASLRPLTAPFVAAAPAGTRVRTRLRVTAQDEAVLQAVGTHLGSLAGKDLAARCTEGRLDAGGRAASRARRKQALTAASSSRWAGAITRISEDQWGLAERNLRAEKAGLQVRVRRIEARLAVPAGGGAGPGRPGDMPPPLSGTPRPCVSGRCAPGWPRCSGGWKRGPYRWCGADGSYCASVIASSLPG